MKYRFAITLSFALVLNLATWLVLYLYIPKHQTAVTLEYNIYTGVSLSGDWYRVLFIPLTGLVIIIVNAVLAVWFRKKQELLLEGFLEASLLLLQVVLTVAAGLILYTNLA